MLPVGGIKEKILAAVAAGMKRVIIPAQNMKDLRDIPRDLRGRIKVMPVERIDEVWPLACAAEPKKDDAATTGAARDGAE